MEKGPQYASKIAARQLLIVASEDVYDESVMIRAQVVHMTVQVVSETDALYFLVARMCEPEVPRWWESEQGREVDRLWSASIGELKSSPRPIPSYALDRHTRRGWQVKREEGWFDDRFSGTDLGRCKTSYLFLRDGEIGPDSRLECDSDGVPDDGFWSVWRARKTLQGDDLPDRPPDHEPEQVSLLDEGEEV